MLISIIIPVLNEQDTINDTLQRLQVMRQQGHEVIVVDGGSQDDTIARSKGLADQVISSAAGRAMQMNHGVVHAHHDVLWFLHADTQVTEQAAGHIQQALRQHDWGRFDIRLSGSHILFRLIEKMINLRSGLSGIATGDQGIFVKRKLFESVNGYASLDLMEDIDLSKKLKSIARPRCIKHTLITSSRRWEEKGILSTVLLMWRIRFFYWLGVSTDTLARQYR